MLLLPDDRERAQSPLSIVNHPERPAIDSCLSNLSAASSQLDLRGGLLGQTLLTLRCRRNEIPFEIMEQTYMIEPSISSATLLEWKKLKDDITRLFQEQWEEPELPAME